MKLCPACAKEKEPSEFIRIRRGKEIPQPVCHSCRRSRWRNKETRRIHPSQYQAYLGSPEWQAKKQAFKESGLNNKGRCEVCLNQKIESHVHHMTYRRLGFEYLSDLKRLCVVCHVAAHKRAGNASKITTKGMRAQWGEYAKRQKVGSLRFSDPVLYAWNVARCFDVSDHDKVIRALSVGDSQP